MVPGVWAVTGISWGTAFALLPIHLQKSGSNRNTPLSRLLPVRPLPAPDELFLSWLMRVAAAHGCKPDRFLQDVSRRFLEGESRRWFQERRALTRDLSQLEQDRVIKLLASLTGCPLDVVAGLTLRRSFHGVPARMVLLARPSHSPSNRTPKLESVQHRESYCPECLREGFYIRREWRLAFYCYCTAHRRELIDACPRCEIDLDFGRRLLADDPPLQAGSNH